ncbi:MAG: chromosomal replication initiator protein DnaA [Deltaproteobacteria bacterium]|nr:chromosomal replication initiator protein DnaA [Deltaproteobacteria bacterium]
MNSSSLDVVGIRVQKDRVWSVVQGSLREKLGAQNFEIWIRPIHMASISDTNVKLEVPNRYYRDWVAANYGPALNAELEEAIGHPVDIQFHVARKSDEPVQPTQTEIRPSKTPSAPIPGVSPDKTFQNFVVGKSNEFAHAAALAVAESPGEAQYNPLFIYGDTGLGKTHLVHAIGNRIRQQDPDARVLYVTAEQFTNELIDSLRYRRMPEFRDRYRKQPTVLLIDDVQFFSGKDRTQEELFHTFEWLNERGRQIVFTSDVLPKEIRGFEPRLRTRCESGMLADTQAPDIETLIAILRQKAEDQNLVIPDEVAQWVTARVHGNVRELEGVVNRLNAVMRLRPGPLTIDVARQHLSSMLDDNPQSISADDIIQTVANFYNVKISDLKGSRRLKQLVRPRHVAMYLIRKYTEHSFPEIGRIFGNRDHATVQHACKKIRSLVKQDVDMKSAVQTLERSIYRGL